MASSASESYEDDFDGLSSSEGKRAFSSSPVPAPRTSQTPKLPSLDVTSGGVVPSSSHPPPAATPQAAQLTPVVARSTDHGPSYTPASEGHGHGAGGSALPAYADADAAATPYHSTGYPTPQQIVVTPLRAVTPPHVAKRLLPAAASTGSRRRRAGGDTSTSTSHGAGVGASAGASAGAGAGAGDSSSTTTSRGDMHGRSSAGGSGSGSGVRRLAGSRPHTHRPPRARTSGSSLQQPAATSSADTRPRWSFSSKGAGLADGPAVSVLHEKAAAAAAAGCDTGSGGGGGGGGAASATTPGRASDPAAFARLQRPTASSVAKRASGSSGNQHTGGATPASASASASASGAAPMQTDLTAHSTNNARPHAPPASASASAPGSASTPGGDGGRNTHSQPASSSSSTAAAGVTTTSRPRRTFLRPRPRAQQRHYYSRGLPRTSRPVRPPRRGRYRGPRPVNADRFKPGYRIVASEEEEDDDDDDDDGDDEDYVGGGGTTDGGGGGGGVGAGAALDSSTGWSERQQRLLRHLQQRMQGSPRAAKLARHSRKRRQRLRRRSHRGAHAASPTTTATPSPYASSPVRSPRTTGPHQAPTGGLNRRSARARRARRRRRRLQQQQQQQRQRLHPHHPPHDGRGGYHRRHGQLYSHSQPQSQPQPQSKLKQAGGGEGVREGAWLAMSRRKPLLPHERQLGASGSGSGNGNGNGNGNGSGGSGGGVGVGGPEDGAPTGRVYTVWQDASPVTAKLSGSSCDNCGKPGIRRCLDCHEVYCLLCDSVIHARPSRRHHSRVQVWQHPAGPASNGHDDESGGGGGGGGGGGAVTVSTSTSDLDTVAHNGAVATKGSAHRRTRKSTGEVIPSTMTGATPAHDKPRFVRRRFLGGAAGGVTATRQAQTTPATAVFTPSSAVIPPAGATPLVGDALVDSLEEITDATPATTVCGDNTPAPAGGASVASAAAGVGTGASGPPLASALGPHIDDSGDVSDADDEPVPVTGRFRANAPPVSSTRPHVVVSTRRDHAHPSSRRPNQAPGADPRPDPDPDPDQDPEAAFIVDDMSPVLTAVSDTEQEEVAVEAAPQPDHRDRNRNRNWNWNNNNNNPNRHHNADNHAGAQGDEGAPPRAQIVSGPYEGPAPGQDAMSLPASMPFPRPAPPPTRTAAAATTTAAEEGRRRRRGGRDGFQAGRRRPHPRVRVHGVGGGGGGGGGGGASRGASRGARKRRAAGAQRFRRSHLPPQHGGKAHAHAAFQRPRQQMGVVQHATPRRARRVKTFGSTGRQLDFHGATPTRAGSPHEEDGARAGSPHEEDGAVDGSEWTTTPSSAQGGKVGEAHTDAADTPASSVAHPTAPSPPRIFTPHAPSAPPTAVPLPLPLPLPLSPSQSPPQSPPQPQPRGGRWGWRHQAHHVRPSVGGRRLRVSKAAQRSADAMMAYASPLPGAGSTGTARAPTAGSRRRRKGGHAGGSGGVRRHHRRRHTTDDSHALAPATAVAAAPTRNGANPQQQPGLDGASRGDAATHVRGHRRVASMFAEQPAGSIDLNSTIVGTPGGFLPRRAYVASSQQAKLAARAAAQDAEAVPGGEDDVDTAGGDGGVDDDGAHGADGSARHESRTEDEPPEVGSRHPESSVERKSSPSADEGATKDSSSIRVAQATMSTGGGLRNVVGGSGGMASPLAQPLRRRGFKPVRPAPAGWRKSSGGKLRARQKSPEGSTADEMFQAFLLNGGARARSWQKV